MFCKRVGIAFGIGVLAVGVLAICMPQTTETMGGTLGDLLEFEASEGQLTVKQIHENMAFLVVAGPNGIAGDPAPDNGAVLRLAPEMTFTFRQPKTVHVLAPLTHCSPEFPEVCRPCLPPDRPLGELIPDLPELRGLDGLGAIVDELLKCTGLEFVEDPGVYSHTGPELSCGFIGASCTTNDDCCGPIDGSVDGGLVCRQGPNAISTDGTTVSSNLLTCQAPTPE